MDKILAVTINLQDKNISPSTEVQTVTADSNYSGLDKVTIEPVTSDIDSNITPENIKKDVSILGVVGTLKAIEGLDIETGNIVVPADANFISIENLKRNPRLIVFMWDKKYYRGGAAVEFFGRFKGRDLHYVFTGRDQLSKPSNMRYNIIATSLVNYSSYEALMSASFDDTYAIMMAYENNTIYARNYYKRSISGVADGFFYAYDYIIVY